MNQSQRRRRTPLSPLASSRPFPSSSTPFSPSFHPAPAPPLLPDSPRRSILPFHLLLPSSHPPRPPHPYSSSHSSYLAAGAICSSQRRAPSRSSSSATAFKSSPSSSISRIRCRTRCSASEVRRLCLRRSFPHPVRPLSYILGFSSSEGLTELCSLYYRRRDSVEQVHPLLLLPVTSLLLTRPS